MVRKRRKKDKQRGMRTHGKGNTKNKRGAGSRGGRGRAGSHKHKFAKYHDTFGGKKRMRPRKKPKALNLEELDSIIAKLLEKKRASKEGDSIVIDGKLAGIGKVLSRGTIKKKLVLKNIKASAKAAEKIAAAGGRVEEPGKRAEGKGAAGEKGEIQEPVEEGKKPASKEEGRAEKAQEAGESEPKGEKGKEGAVE